MKFQSADPRTGEVTYPNNAFAMEAALRCAYWCRPELARMPNVPGGSGYPANYSKAVGAMQEFDRGVPMSEIKGMGPKTSVYHNAWLRNPPGYFVSDVHSGGGGALPHLAANKPYKRDEEGNFIYTKGGQKAKEKSEARAGLRLLASIR